MSETNGVRRGAKRVGGMMKAQVTLFIMLGMVLLVLSAIVFYIVDLTSQKVFVHPIEPSSAEQLVEQCLGLLADDALLVIGKHGGYAELGVNYFEPLKTSYLYDAGVNNAPDSATVEQQLSEYIDAHIMNCLGNFELLRDKGIEVIEKAQPRTTTIIAGNSVRFTIDYKIEEKKGDMITTPEFLPTMKAVRLAEILQLANDIVASEQKNNNLFDLDVECSLEVTHFPVEKTLVTVITDTNFLIQDSPYRFVFAHKR